MRPWGSRARRTQQSDPKRYSRKVALLKSMSISIWVVVKIMVPFWLLLVIRHLVFRGPKKGDRSFDNHPYLYRSKIYSVHIHNLGSLKLSSSLGSEPEPLESRMAWGPGLGYLCSEALHCGDIMAVFTIRDIYIYIYTIYIYMGLLCMHITISQVNIGSQ